MAGSKKNARCMCNGLMSETKIEAAYSLATLVLIIANSILGAILLLVELCQVDSPKAELYSCISSCIRLYNYVGLTWVI